MNILFVHQNFPGQYKHLIDYLAKKDDVTIVGLGINALKIKVSKRVSYKRYEPKRGNTEDLDPLLIETETKVIRGEACAEAALQLKHDGFQPDIICAHPGWGEALFLRDIWPKAPLLSYQEFWYEPNQQDHLFDPEFTQNTTWRESARIRMRTNAILHALNNSAWNISPTEFQKNSFPIHWQQYITTLHDGIDTQAIHPATKVSPITLPDGSRLDHSEEIITYVNRAIEPYRGCHTLIRAIPRLQQLAPNAHLIIIGDPNINGYGKRLSHMTWAEYFFKEIQGDFDPSKVHITGTLPYDNYLHLLQLSKAHIYLTYPFVLSWSLLEAMSAGCRIIGSSTKPVQEIIDHGINGLLVDFFDPNQLAETTAEVIKNNSMGTHMGIMARKTILERYSLHHCIPKHVNLLQDICNNRT